MELGTLMEPESKTGAAQEKPRKTSGKGKVKESKRRSALAGEDEESEGVGGAAGGLIRF